MQINVEKTKSQIKKGFIEFCVLQIISQGEVYSTDILTKLKVAKLLVVEGTLYPLLSRLRREKLVDYKWIESENGPPRKYYLLTKLGIEKLSIYKTAWTELSRSLGSLFK